MAELNVMIRFIWEAVIKILIYFYNENKLIDVICLGVSGHANKIIRVYDLGN